MQRLGDEGDDAWRDERAVDPLHCARIDAKPSGDLAHTGPSRSRQSLSDLFFEGRGYRGPPEAFCGLESLFLARHGLVPQSSPEIPEPIGRKLGIPDRVLDVLVAEPCLQCPGVMAGIGQRVAAAVPQHVRVDWERHFGPLSDPAE